MKTITQLKKNVLIITLQCDYLDASITSDLKTELIQSIEESGVIQVVCNLEHIEFVDSSGLGLMIALLRHLASKNGDLKLACMSSKVYTIFKMVRMHTLFEIYSSVSDAMHTCA